MVKLEQPRKLNHTFGTRGSMANQEPSIINAFTMLSGLLYGHTRYAFHEENTLTITQYYTSEKQESK